MYAPLQTNPSPLAAQRLQLQAAAMPVNPVQPLANPIANPAALQQAAATRLMRPPVLPTNASPTAALRLAQLGTAGRPPSPVQMPQPPNPALQAQRAAMPRGFGTVLR
jgi:hypothetical protein